MGKSSINNSKWLKDLAGSWIFYTALPGLGLIKPSFERIARFAPLIGILTGSIQAALWLILDYSGWATEAISLLAITTGILITGGLHFDGLMDTADGLGAGQSKCLEAMKDSRVGSSGVQSILLIILIQIAALIKLDTFAPIALIIASFWGRCAPLWAIWKFPYIHFKGASEFHKSHWKGVNELLPTIILICIVFIILPLITDDFSIYYLITIGILPTIIVPHILGKQLNGHNGDTYGACVVIVESITLLLLSLSL